jgi:hypothetical protein
MLPVMGSFASTRDASNVHIQSIQSGVLSDQVARQADVILEK